MSETKITAFKFNAAEVEPQKPNEVIPAGWYPCEIIDAEVKPTGKGRAAKGKGAYFNYKVLAGDYKGRVIFGSCINVENANAQCQEIGQRELSSICHAVGIINVEDLAPFVGKQLEVKVKVKKASDEEKEKGYEDRNEPSGYKALAGATGAPAGPTGFTPAPPPPIGAPSAPPVTPPAPPTVAEAFPPQGWQANPNAQGWYWNAQTGEQLTEADLRAKSAAPVAPPAPPAPPVVPPAPPAPPVVEFPPAGWLPHPQSPGYFYSGNDVKSEAELRAMVFAPAVPSAPPVPAGPPAPPSAPVAGSPPPWKQPAA